MHVRKRGSVALVLLSSASTVQLEAATRMNCQLSFSLENERQRNQICLHWTSPAEGSPLSVPRPPPCSPTHFQEGHSKDHCVQVRRRPRQTSVWGSSECSTVIAVDRGCDPVAPRCRQLCVCASCRRKETRLPRRPAWLRHSVLTLLNSPTGTTSHWPSAFLSEKNSHGAIWLQMKQGKLVLVLL